jgi:cytosine/adenosine deaminase-related metal-dependent hydrolase
VIGVGPPDLFVPHISVPWSGSFFENGKWVEKPFTYDDAVANSVKVIEKWHKRADGRIRIALHPPYIFGRHNILRQTRYNYASEDIPVMIEKAEEMRELADKYLVQIHTYLFGGSVNFAVRHFGRERVDRLLGPDVVVEHGNGLMPNEVKVLGKNRCNVATAPSTGENIHYGYAPIIELLEAGANVTITTDGSAPLFSFDLWKDIQRAMWHQWITHKSRARVLPVGKALRMVTIDAALALGIDKEVGSLEVGKKADVILIDFNSPHLTPKTFVPNLLAYYVNGNDVDTVLVDGKILMEGKQILSVDKYKVMELARKESERAFNVLSVEHFKDFDKEFWHSARFS